MLSTSELSTIIRQFCFIERDELETAGRLSDKGWRDFQADPHGQFVKLSDRHKSVVTASINRRLAATQRHHLIAAE